MLGQNSEDNGRGLKARGGYVLFLVSTKLIFDGGSRPTGPGEVA